MAKKGKIKSKQISSTKTRRRLKNISEIHKLKQKTESNASRLDKVAYILWQYPNTRDSDRTLALEYYKVFYPDRVANDTISFENIYYLPKMYDIQRDRATIQNDEGLFQAKEEIIELRLKGAKEYKECYAEANKDIFIGTADYHIYFDESGKTDKFFVLGGISINGEQNKKNLIKQLEDIKNKLEMKHNISIQELKFSEIKKSNLAFYKELIDQFSKLDYKPMFYAIFLENNGLNKSSKRDKSIRLLQLLLIDVIELIVSDTVKNSKLKKLAQLNICLDEDGGQEIDHLVLTEISKQVQKGINEEYLNFVELQSLKSLDSKGSILLQISDLYASSLNNIFSDKPIDSDKAKAKREFAELFLDIIGIKNIDDNYKKDNDTKYIHNCVIKKATIED